MAEMAAGGDGTLSSQPILDLGVVLAGRYDIQRLLAESGDQLIKLSVIASSVTTSAVPPG